MQQPDAETTITDQIDLYRSIVAGDMRNGDLGRILFCVSTDDLAEKKGDLFVALGLAKALVELGWGVSLWPTSRFTERTPADIDIAVVMIESTVPGFIREGTRLIAWVRNWVDAWKSLPFLDEYDQLWCSSSTSAATLREVYDGPVVVVPIATDPDLFTFSDGARPDLVATTTNYWGVDRGIMRGLSLTAAEFDVVWYGMNSEHLSVSPNIDHRRSVDYFSVPSVYQRSLIVVDDVIEAAAAYGNQNSRLFDALACGAVVVSNTRNGLDELGLSELPTYRDAAELLEIVRELVADVDGTRELGRRMKGIVLERHTYRIRAAELMSHLHALRWSEKATSPRSALLQWAASERERTRAVEKERDDWQSYFHASRQELKTLRAELEDRLAASATREGALVAELHGIRSSRSYQFTVRASHGARPLIRAVDGLRRRVSRRHTSERTVGE